MTETEKDAIIARLSSIAYDEIQSTMPEDQVLQNMVAKGWDREEALAAIRGLRSGVIRRTVHVTLEERRREDRRVAAKSAWPFIWSGIAIVALTTILSVVIAIMTGTFTVIFIGLAAVGLVSIGEGLRRLWQK